MSGGYGYFFTRTTAGQGGGGGGAALLGINNVIITTGMQTNFKFEGMYVSSTEAFPVVYRRIPMPKPGNLHDFSVSVHNNSLAVQTTFTVYKNGVATGASVTVPAGNAGNFSSGTMVSVGANDLVSIVTQADNALSGQLTASAAVLYTPT